MTVSEAVVAATLGGAAALRRSDVGRIVVGGPADLVLLDAPSHPSRVPAGRGPGATGLAARPLMTDDPRWRAPQEWLVCATAPASVPDLGLLGVPAHLIDLANQRPSHSGRRAARWRASQPGWNPQVPTFGTCVQSTSGTSPIPTVRPVRCAPAGSSAMARPLAGGARWRQLDHVRRGTSDVCDRHGDSRRPSRCARWNVERIAGGPPGRVRDGWAGHCADRDLDFANSREYAARARDYGITIIGRDEVAGRGMVSVMEQALQIAGRGEGPRVHVDLDVDVCDRAVAPACPASVPGV